MSVNLPNLGNGNTIIFGCIVGSHAYGTNVEGSDEDRKWVYVQSHIDLFINGYRPQIELSKDEVAYELSRFLELALKANPTILELLFSPEDCILYKHPSFDKLLNIKRQFLTKQCRLSFGGYAISQIEKARGLDKKMNWEKEKTVRKTVLDFCYWIEQAINPRLNDNYQSAPIKTVFSETQLAKMALSAIPNTRGLYNVFCDVRYVFHGIADETSNDIRTQEVPRDAVNCGMLFFNKDAYSIHCKEYNEYTNWLQKRNTQRYVDIEGHGQMIDGKNLLHCVRLIEMAIDIAEKKELVVRRPNAEFLKEIRHGKHNLNEILEHAKEGIDKLDEAFNTRLLPERFPAESFLKYLNYDIRKQVESERKEVIKPNFK
jgi:predicted nucleotidyltransferase